MANIRQILFLSTIGDDMFIIAETTNVDSRSTVLRHLIATESVYGGEFLPCFEKREDAEHFLGGREDSYRRFEIIEIPMHSGEQ